MICIDILGANRLNARGVQPIHGLVEQENFLVFHGGLQNAQFLFHAQGIFPHAFSGMGIQADFFHFFANLWIGQAAAQGV